MAERKKPTTGIALRFANGKGQGLVEYSVILHVVAVVMIAVLYALGTTVNSDLYEPINNAVSGAGN